MISFRPSTPDDAKEVSACVDAVARERRFLGNVVGFTADETRSFLASLAEKGGVQIIALDERVVIGWCDVSVLPFEGMRHVGRLGMGVLPAYRGQGLGRRLLREALSHMFACGLLRVELEVFASNLPAIKLYEREGFLTEGRKRLARILSSVEDDILVMGILSKEWRLLPGNENDGTAAGAGWRLPRNADAGRRNEIAMSQLFRFPSAVKRDPAIAVWMHEHLGELGAIAQRWFEVMRACGDDVRELLHDGHPTACVTDAAFGYVNAFKAHVNVGFFRGAEIADPEGLLEGTGKFMRHVKLSPERDVNARALRKLIETAYTDMKGRLKAG